MKKQTDRLYVTLFYIYISTYHLFSAKMPTLSFFLREEESMKVKNEAFSKSKDNKKLSRIYERREAQRNPLKITFG